MFANVVLLCRSGFPWLLYQISIQNRSKIDRKSIKNQSKIDQKSIRNRPKIDQNHRWSEKCRALRLGNRLGGVLEASWAHLRGQHSSKLASQIEGQSIKNQCKNQTKIDVMLGVLLPRRLTPPLTHCDLRRS